jgi:intracellular sulfur oxidation DsrE/DsrF family protein
MKKILLIFASILFITTLSSASPPTTDFKNDQAVYGLTEAKAYFDVTVGDPGALLTRLQLIEKTYNQLVAAGVTPSFIIGIRGKASNFFTKGSDYVLDIDLPAKIQIARLVEKFKAMNVGVEQCRIAAGFQEIEEADFLPQIELVDNGYASMIVYQSQGYGFVPMD